MINISHHFQPLGRSGKSGPWACTWTWEEGEHRAGYGGRAETQRHSQHNSTAACGLLQRSKGRVLGPRGGPYPEQVAGSATASTCILRIPFPLQVPVNLLLHWWILNNVFISGRSKGGGGQTQGSEDRLAHSSGTARAAGLKNHQRCPSVESIVEWTSWLHSKWNIWSHHTRAMFLVHVADRYITAHLTF